MGQSPASVTLRDRFAGHRPGLLVGTTASDGLGLFHLDIVAIEHLGRWVGCGRVSWTRWPG
jgi:hypothetical protein